MKELTLPQMNAKKKTNTLINDEIHIGNYDGTKLTNLIYFKNNAEEMIRFRM